MTKEYFENINIKRQKLEDIKTALKEKFIGIDDVIDKIIDNIKLWYLAPEIQYRPLIISLWGITGVGKTDLVRTLVKLLNFTDKFVEIQMDMKADYYSKDIQDYLENSGIESTVPSILLLDEIQRYRTKDEEGKMIENKNFNDIWMLLSDGKFKNDSKRRVEILEAMLEEKYYQEQLKTNKEKSKEEDSDEKTEKSSEQSSENNKIDLLYKTSYWTANKFKKLLGLTEPVENIMKMPIEDRINILENSLKCDNVNEGKSYEKLLIFISGNLDEAFYMSDEIEDADKDADIYHEQSKRINVINIKAALSKKFKPEQIARFGNNHIIYPCLDKKSYYIIIKKYCSELLNRIKKEHNVDIELTQNVYDVIYRNGVFPTQGVRPVVSTVFNILGSNLPHFLFLSFENNVNKLIIDFENNKLFTIINNKNFEKFVHLDLDTIKKEKSIDEKMLLIVHELGHSLVYSILFKTVPKQININSSSIYASGFMISHNTVDNKIFIKDKACVYLAGLVAEEIVFGENYRATGSAHDLTVATDLFANYVRRYGMDGSISRIAKENTMSEYDANYDLDKTNSIIENLLVDEKKRTRDILNKNLNIFKKLIQFTVDNNNIITINDFYNICLENNIELKMTNDKIIYSYDEKLKDFLK
jgi:cell division protease FtsH